MESRRLGLLPQLSDNQPQTNPPAKFPRKAAIPKYPVLQPVRTFYTLNKGNKGNNYYGADF